MNRIEAMESAARKAAQFMLGSDADTESKTKTNARDLVTVSDIKAQNVIRDELSTAFPDELIISEEDDAELHQKLNDENFTGFVIDPIDGTYNFKRGMQESAISVGYIENGQSVAGVIYDCYKDELYIAEQGKGATLNGESVHVSSQTELDGSSVATSNGYDYAAAARNLERQTAIYKQTGIMPWTSCPGSAVLTLAWIAAGRIDAIHHTGFKPFDCAAAFVIVSEAGGKIEKLGGGAARFTDPALLIGTPAIFDKLHEAFAKLPTEILT